jgi:hypothetical protein
LSPTLDPFPANGLGVPGPSPPNRLVAVLAPSWLGDPNDDFLPPPKPPVTAFWKRGLAADGEYGDPLRLLSEAGLPLPDSGELVCDLLLVADPARDGVREYLGGVLIAELGVGGVELGGRPRSFL